MYQQASTFHHCQPLSTSHQRWIRYLSTSQPLLDTTGHCEGLNLPAIDHQAGSSKQSPPLSPKNITIPNMRYTYIPLYRNLYPVKRRVLGDNGNLWTSMASAMVSRRQPLPLGPMPWSWRPPGQLAGDETVSVAEFPTTKISGNERLAIVHVAWTTISFFSCYTPWFSIK